MSEYVSVELPLKIKLLYSGIKLPYSVKPFVYHVTRRYGSN